MGLRVYAVCIVHGGEMRRTVFSNFQGLIRHSGFLPLENGFDILHLVEAGSRDLLKLMELQWVFTIKRVEAVSRMIEISRLQDHVRVGEEHRNVSCGACTQ